MCQVIFIRPRRDECPDENHDIGMYCTIESCECTHIKLGSRVDLTEEEDRIDNSVRANAVQLFMQKANKFNIISGEIKNDS
mmetsp:Transcript_15931/g.19760  ORF Transcript_15931/g.19760 Transcript_15931/m.19760 type:complete len:81 (+) Transcript_15931:281-523(+)